MKKDKSKEYVYHMFVIHNATSSYYKGDIYMI